MTISQNQQPIETGIGRALEPDEILSGIDLNGKNVLVTGGYSGIGLEPPALCQRRGMCRRAAQKPRKPLWTALLMCPYWRYGFGRFALGEKFADDFFSA